MNKVLIGDNLTWLKSIKSGIVQTCITSPPYWGLRDYGHDEQTGLEDTFDKWLSKMVMLFREIERVLRDDGTIWVNMGDSYAGSGKGIGSDHGKAVFTDENIKKTNWENIDLPPKNLLGQPWRLAFALQDDGWILRSDIIWAKPNPMPESVTDRPTKAHEYLFLMSKKPHYYYDADAIREPHKESIKQQIKRIKYAKKQQSERLRQSDNQTDALEKWSINKEDRDMINPFGANKRSVWIIPTEAYSKAHFATFPKALVKPCILAGSSRECCAQCLKPYKRDMEIFGGTIGKSWHDHADDLNGGQSQKHDFSTDGYERKTLGFSPDCGCGTKETKPSLVLDPFSGSGTTGAVCAEYGRNYLGIELNPEYANMRIEERSVQTFL